VLVASLALLAVVVWWQPGGETPSGPTTGLDVVVIGVDTMDWFVLRGLLVDAALPSTTSLLRRGVTGEIAADRPPLPEVGWTALGRGRTLAEGELSQVSRTDGRLYGLTPEIARIVERAGGRTLTVGWPASWPAGGAEGIVVAPYRPASATHETGLPAAILAGDAGACGESLRERIDGIVARNEEILEEEFDRLIFDGEGDGMWAEHLEAARWAFLSDLIAIDATASLMAEQSPDLTMVCLGGLDAVSHRFLAPAMPSFFPDSPEDYAIYEDVLDNYYRFIDDCVERLRRLTDEESVIVICSTYGLHPTADVPGISGSHVNNPPGVLVLRGAGVAQRAQALELSSADFAPTLLALLGVPIPTDIDGRVVPEALPVGFLQSFPPVYDGTMDIPEVTPDASLLSAADALVAERLSRLRNAGQ
jgi:hypothetical protein